MGERLDNFRDTLRTAPVGLGAVAMHVMENISLIALTNPEMPDSAQQGAAYTVWAASAAIGLASGGGIMYKQFRLRHRLERIVDNHGYDERAFTTVTNTWCDRQTARVVCERAGILPQFEELCDTRKDSMRLSSIPHV